MTDKLYQTLPLYSNLQTTGVYIYAEDIQVRARKKLEFMPNRKWKMKQRKARRLVIWELFDRDGSL